MFVPKPPNPPAPVLPNAPKPGVPEVVVEKPENKLGAVVVAVFPKIPNEPALVPKELVFVPNKLLDVVAVPPNDVPKSDGVVVVAPPNNVGAVDVLPPKRLGA